MNTRTSYVVLAVIAVVMITSTSEAFAGGAKIATDSEDTKIIGSFVVPEFATIVVALILAIAFISIIAVSTKTRLSILPKY